MLNDKDSEMLRSQISWNAERQHREEMNYIFQKQEYSLVSALGLKPYKDGNQWCFCWGDNIQDGICGFGGTVYKALTDFNNNYNSEIITIPAKRNE